MELIFRLFFKGILLTTGTYIRWRFLGKGRSFKKFKNEELNYLRDMGVGGLFWMLTCVTAYYIYIGVRLK